MTNCLKKAYIYRLCCKDTDIKEEYIGSTKNFTKRKAQHKRECVKKTDLKVYNFICENGGTGIIIAGGYNIQLIQNTISKNSAIGITLSANSYNNQIVNNSITEHQFYGIQLSCNPL